MRFYLETSSPDRCPDRSHAAIQRPPSGQSEAVSFGPVGAFWLPLMPEHSLPSLSALIGTDAGRSPSVRRVAKTPPQNIRQTGHKAWPAERTPAFETAAGVRIDHSGNGGGKKQAQPNPKQHGLTA